MIRAFLEQQEVDPCIGCSLERLRPAGGRASVSPSFLAPAVESVRLVLRLGALEDRRDRLEQLGRTGLRAGGSPADERLARFRGQLVGELGAHLLRAHEHDAWRMQAAPAAVELLRDALQMLLDELLDVTPVTRL